MTGRAARSTTTTPASSAESGLYPDLESPPPVTVRYFDQSIDLLAWSYCYGSVCADGFPPAEPPDVGSPQEVIVEFPLEGWSFTASFSPTGGEVGDSGLGRLALASPPVVRPLQPEPARGSLKSPPRGRQR